MVAARLTAGQPAFTTKGLRRLRLLLLLEDATAAGRTRRSGSDVREQSESATV